jgi:hypothetical protein
MPYLVRVRPLRLRLNVPPAQAGKPFGRRNQIGTVFSSDAGETGEGTVQAARHPACPGGVHETGERDK